MSLIILDQNLAPKRYHVHSVPKYKSIGVGNHLPTGFLAAMSLRNAIQKGATEIVVEIQGQLPRKYDITQVIENCKKDPSLHKFLPTTIPIRDQRIIHKFDGGTLYGAPII